MDLIFIKIFSASVILIISLIAGLIPVRTAITDQNRTFFNLGEALASGVFLGAALLHMLPDAEHLYQNMTTTDGYPYVNGLAALAFIFLLFIEKVVFQFQTSELVQNRSIIPYILAVVLSVHSLFAGAALGISSSFMAMLVIFLAIIAHKGSASFALAISLKRSALSVGRMRNVIILFSLMTPIGILFGTGINTIAEMVNGQILESGFNAFAAGTFLYIATMHGIDKQFIQDKVNHLQAFLMLLIGFSLMAVVAVWM